MHHKTIISAIAGILALEACAASTITYSYANDDLELWGTGKKEKYDIAMCVNDPSLAGKKVTSVRALISDAEGASDFSLWMTKELKIEKNKNVPDLFSESVATTEVTLEDGFKCRQLQIDLETPYVLDLNPVYFGYSLSIDSNTQTEDKNPVVLSDAQNPNGIFVHLSRSCLTWLDYSDKLGKVAAIYLTVEGDFEECAAGVKELPLTYAAVGEDFTIPSQISNIGSEAITSIDYSYALAGGQGSGHIDFPTPLEPDMFNPHRVDLPVEGVAETGIYEITVTIDKVNGQDNANVAASGKGEVRILPFMPVNRPLLEEFTGTWCGWCTRGWLGLEMVGERYGDSVVCIAYHNGDPMTVTDVYPIEVSGYPSATLNRTGRIDPFFGSHMSENIDFGISLNLDEAMREMVVGDLEIKAEWADDSMKAINVTTDTRFIYDLDGIDYQLAYILVANGLQNRNWAQKNYYSGHGEEYAGSYLEELTEWPSTVSDLVFNDVAIDTEAMLGVVGSIPSYVKEGVAYTHATSFNVASNRLAMKKDAIYVVAVILDKANSKVINANRTLVMTPSGIGAMDGQDAVSEVYYDLQGRVVSHPSKGVYVKMTTRYGQPSEISKVMIK